MYTPTSSPDPLWTTAPYAYAFWTVYFLAFLPEIRLFRRRRDIKNVQMRDKGSIWAITVLMFFSIFLGFLFSGIMPPIARISWHPAAWFALGLALMLTGVSIRQIAMGILGGHFTRRVEIQPDHQLIKRGLYRYVRHPSYTGAYFIFLGLGLALGNIVSLLLIFGAAILAYGFRVHVEEKALKEIFGSGYEDYCRCTKRFVPGLF